MASAGGGGGGLEGGATEVLDWKAVPSSLQPVIAPILRAADAVENERPRVAYLCRYHAFEKAHRLDETSSGPGVRQFKTALLQRLERDDLTSVSTRLMKTDDREIVRFYKQYYEKYILELNKEDKADRVHLGKAYQTAVVLFEVLHSVCRSEKVSEEGSIS